jgi:hypothetical protein
VSAFFDNSSIPSGSQMPPRARAQIVAGHCLPSRLILSAGITTQVGRHTFRATGVTAYLKNGGTLEKAAQMANHASTRTTQLFDRRRTCCLPPFSCRRSHSRRLDLLHHEQVIIAMLGPDYLKCEAMNVSLPQYLQYQPAVFQQAPGETSCRGCSWSGSRNRPCRSGSK